MKKYLSAFAGLMFVTVSYSQSADVISQLKQFNVSLYDLLLNVQPTSTAYSFNMEYSVPHPQYPVTYQADFNPTRNPAWVMTSWNGKEPEKYQTNSLKDRVARYATAPVMVDESSLKTTTEGNYLIVSFRVIAASVPKQYAYLKDCDGKAYINTSSGRLERTAWKNFQPTRNGVVRVKNIEEEVSFMFDDGVYHVQKETQFMGGSVSTRVGERGGEASQVITYSNYKKVG